MEKIPMLTIDLDKKCAECGKGGAAGNGLCMGCTTKVIQGRPMKSAAGQAVAEGWKKVKANNNRPRA